MNTTDPKASTSPTPEPPLCAAFDPRPRTPRITLPPLACDSHAHICGPKAVHPYSPERVFTPPDAPLADYLHLLDTLGFERAVLVQPSFYGTNNTAMLEALTGGGSRFRGVAVIDDNVDEDELARMHEAGVRGVRVNVVDVKDRRAGTLPLTQLEKLARRVAPFGWHLELLMHVDEFADIDRTFGDFPVETVYGHLGYMKSDRGTDNPGFQGLLRLMKDGKAWVKLTGPYRISTQPLPHPDTNAYAQALIAAAPDRVVWGSDWPHVNVKTPMPNDGDLCDILSDWIPDPALRQQVLVDNPARLYGFD